MMVRKISRNSLFVRRFYSTKTKIEHKLEQASTSKEPRIIIEPGNETSNENKVTMEVKTDPIAPAPTYFGYLSGVATTLWNSAHWLGELAKPVKVTQSTQKKVIVHTVSRSEITNRTITLVNQILNAESQRSKLLRADQLNRHLMTFPASRVVAVQNRRLVSFLLENLKRCQDVELRSKICQCLSLCGYVRPPRGSGINLLTIDGGGTRGMMGLEILEALEQCCGGKKISELFDIIVGVSTGAIIASLVGAKGFSVQEAKKNYMEISRKLFDQGKFSGVSGLLLSHSYYNTAKWIEILKEFLGENFSLIDSAQNPNAPKIAIISCIVNSLQLQPFVFRNYEHLPGTQSHYRGSSQYKMWQAIQASAAAPGYFQEVTLGSVLHQDGGVLVNNPTGVALHESRLLWPDYPLQSVVSIGNGRNVSEIELAVTTGATWAHEKLSKIVDSATDTELVHNCVSDLIPKKIYYRFNPYMSTPYSLDEIEPLKLNQMERDAKLYIRRNRRKIEKAAIQLKRSPSYWQKIIRAFKLFRDERGWI